MFRQTCDSNKSFQIWRAVILRHIFVQITFETRKRNTGFYVLRQGVPEGRSSDGYTSLRERETDRQTDRQRQRERQRDRETGEGGGVGREKVTCGKGSRQSKSTYY